MSDSGEDVLASGVATPAEGEEEELVTIEVIDDDEAPAPAVRDTWGSTISYILTLVGYAVGFGNIWRFPYQVRENGGIVFLIPYCTMLALVGVPTFFLELAVGQRRRKGIIYAWNEISPAFGGLGICCGWVCFLVGLYYNTLLAYCISYLVDSFQSPLQWTNCETVGTEEDRSECTTHLLSKASKYYWYRGTLGVSSGIDEWGGYSIPLFVYHVIAWGLVWLILWKGTKLIGKVVYFTAVFPYVVLILFFIANCIIEPEKGWLGAYRLLTPNWAKLLEPITWLKAGSQIFFSLGLGLGCLVVFASYSPARNNCYKDAIIISLINCGTSVFAALVVFPMIGALGFRNYETCFADMKSIFPSMNATVDDHYDIYFTTTATDWNQISNQNPIHVRYGYGEMTNDAKMDLGNWRPEEIIENITSVANASTSMDFNFAIKDCSIGKEATASGGGTGFVFVGFTEAVKHLPFSNLWSGLFFFMLFLLGIDSGFGTVEGSVAAIEDWTGFNRAKSAAIVCGTLMALALAIFPFGNGIYILDLLDQYTANWTLLVMALMECMAVAWAYGLAKFSYDVKLMTGRKPNLYILLCWKYLTPSVVVILLVGSVIQFAMQTVDEGISYTTFQPDKSADKSGEFSEPLPAHSLATGFILMFFCMIWLPIQAVLRKTKFNLLKGQGLGDFPEEELRAERNIFVAKEEDQFTSTEKRIMGKESLLNLQQHRDRTTSSTSLTRGNVSQHSLR